MKQAFAFLALATLLTIASPASAVIVDDFNLNEGHMGYAPTFASQSVGEAAGSTADRVTTNSPFEGLGHQRLSLVHDGSATNMRIRHVGGGAPFGSGQSGNPANNYTFTTSAGVDGFIGFYAKTSTNNTGWTLSLNLDDVTAAGAGMDGGTAKPLIADGQWHLYEWNLDDDNQWVAVASIGGDGTIQHGQHSFDSIYIFTNTTGTNGQTRDPLFIDFIAHNPAGSIAALVPAVPEASSFLAVGLVGLVLGGAKWLRRKPTA